jgi:hypothetical protein
MALDFQRAPRVEKLLAGDREGHSQATDLPPRSPQPTENMGGAWTEKGHFVRNYVR